MSKIIAFIPARGGSKSIPSKNIKPFCGKPLIYWNLKALSQVKQIKEIFVATDNLEIKKVVEEFSLQRVKVYIRSPQNAQDTSSTESVMLEFIHNQNLDGNSVFLLAQATSPFTQPKDFTKGLKLYHTPKINSVLSCCRIKRFLWDEKGRPLNYNYKARPRRQEFKGQLIENGALYINSVKNILRHKNRLSGRIGIHEMPEYTFFEIDEEQDWMIAEILMRKHVIKSTF